MLRPLLLQRVRASLQQQQQQALINGGGNGRPAAAAAADGLLAMASAAGARQLIQRRHIDYECFADRWVLIGP